jgi:Glycoside hydrolase family 44
MILVLCCALLTACGGGSGTNDSTSSNGTTPAKNAESTTTEVGSATTTPAVLATDVNTTPNVAPIVTATTSTTIVPVVEGPSFSLYDEVPRSAWAEAGWNSTVDLATKAVPASSGGVSASVAFTNPYGAFALANWNDPAITADYNAIAFSVRGSSSARYLELFVEGIFGSSRSATSLPDIQPGAWKEVVVYLSDLGLPASIYRVGLANDSRRMDYTNAANAEYNSTFYVDNVRLVKIALPPAPPSQTGPTLVVNAAANRKPISQEIYGLNWEKQTAFAEEIKLPVNRWGGDATSRFNFNTNHSNPGFNWYFANRDEGITPATFIAFNRRAASNTIMTLPMIGWAAKDASSCGYSIARYGAQTSQAPDRADCGGGYLTGGIAITNNAPTDTSVAANVQFYKPWIQSLVATYGRADQGGIRYYNLDNEPGIWHSTHRDLGSDGLTHTSLLSRSIAAAEMLKSVDPSALTLGPSEDGWTRYVISGRDTQLGNYSATYDGLWAVEWYLKEMRAYEQRSGKRLLDYLDLHYYPQASGVYGAAGSKETQALRLRSVRSLWDPTYVDESWISTTGIQNVNLIGRMRNWVNTHYPGTKLAITEYNFGALNHINGALAQADVLGVFGREGVDIATLWGPPESYAPDTGLFADKPGAFAMRMYRNYDGLGGRFGDTSVLATSSNQDKLSIYGSIDSADGSLKIMVINKTETPLASSIALQGFTAANIAKIYRYGPANLAAIEKETTPVTANTVSTTFAPNSITLIRIAPL